MKHFQLLAYGSGGLFGADLDNPEIPMEVTQTFPETLQPRAVKFDVGAISHTGNRFEFNFFLICMNSQSLTMLFCYGTTFQKYMKMNRGAPAGMCFRHNHRLPTLKSFVRSGI